MDTWTDNPILQAALERYEARANACDEVEDTRVVVTALLINGLPATADELYPLMRHGMEATIAGIASGVTLRGGLLDYGFHSLLLGYYLRDEEWRKAGSPPPAAMP